VPVTTQDPDTCSFDGRIWDIGDHCELYKFVPTSKSLGFKTVSASSSNWSGRIDHFLVYNCLLFLHKIQVNLHPDDANFIPSNAGKEVVERYEPFTNFTGSEQEQKIVMRRQVSFVFAGGDFKLTYTGDLVLFYPHMDLWEIPATQEEEDYHKRALLPEKRAPAFSSPSSMSDKSPHSTLKSELVLALAFRAQKAFPYVLHLLL
jgi:hypothetical protein